MTGAGAAGCLAAIALSDRVGEVHLRSSTGGARASFLMTATPGFGAALGQLGLGEAWREYGGRQPVRRSASHWGSETRPAAWNALQPLTLDLVDRAHLEAWLLEQALARGVRLADWSTSASQNACDVFEVDASGRASVIARRRGVRRRGQPHLIALCGDGEVSDLDVGETMVASGTEGWWYAARSAATSSLLYLTSPRRSAANRDAAWGRAFEQCPALRRRFSGPPRRHQPVFVASSSWLENPGGENWAAVGDAALACDPLSSGGLEIAATTALALRSAYFESSPNPDCFRADMLSKVAAYRIGRQRTYQRGAPDTAAPFWRAQAEL